MKFAKVTILYEIREFVYARKFNYSLQGLTTKKT